jgi:signal peptidase I
MAVNKNDIKKALKKTWHFIWEDDSILSWIVNIILAFVLIKFIVYPGLGLVFGTSYPIVAVVSGSMEHDGSFDDWWVDGAYCEQECTQEQWYAQYNIDKEEFKDFKLKNGFNKGDIIFLRGAKKTDVGDVLVFISPYKKEPIIHRVVEIQNVNDDKIYQTKGDHNVAAGKHDKDIHEKQVLGKAMFKVPFLGWIKIGFVELLKLFGIYIS